MSVLLELLFVGLGGVALAVIVASLRQAAAPLTALRSAMRQPAAIDEVRLTLREHRVITRAPRSLLRHRHGPKPITHRLGRLVSGHAAA